MFWLPQCFSEQILQTHCSWMTRAKPHPASNCRILGFLYQHLQLAVRGNHGWESAHSHHLLLAGSSQQLILSARKDKTESSRRCFLLTDLERLSPSPLSAKILEFFDRKTKPNQPNKKPRQETRQPSGPLSRSVHRETPSPSSMRHSWLQAEEPDQHRSNSQEGMAAFTMLVLAPDKGNGEGGTAPQLGVNIYVH